MTSGEQTSIPAVADVHCRVKVRYFGPMIALLHTVSDEVLLKKGKSRVIDLIEELCKRHGDEFREIAIHNGALNSGLVVFVNGQSVLDPSEELKETDQIQVLIASQMKGG